MRKKDLKELSIEELKIRATTSKVVTWVTIAGILLFFGCIHYPYLRDGKIDMEVIMPISLLLSIFLIGVFVEIKKLDAEIRSRSKLNNDNI